MRNSIKWLLKAKRHLERGNKRIALYFLNKAYETIKNRKEKLKILKQKAELDIEITTERTIPGSKRMMKRIDLINEKRLSEAILEKDVMELRDALNDVMNIN